MATDNHSSSAPFPSSRPRRLRHGPLLRDAVADVALRPANLILPLFIAHTQQPVAVGSMPGVYQWPVEAALHHMAALSQRGLKQFILFGVTPPEHKDSKGSYAMSPDSPVSRLLTEARKSKLDAIIYADLCFCEYTDHGHCGVLGDDGPWVVDNDATLAALAQQAVALAKAGADVVAPSGMMDGQVGAVRAALDEAGFTQVAILAYSVKYASSFYGPFREAGQGGMKFGDRRGYQMDYRRRLEWRTELEADLSQGADMVMVKPAGPCLDVIHQVRRHCSVPLAAYQVSGEYSMIHAAAGNGWLDLKETVLETTYAIRRAGADLILTYFAESLLDWLP